MINVQTTSIGQKIWSIFEAVPWHKLDKEVGIKLRNLGAYDLSEFIPDSPAGRFVEKEFKRFFALRLLEPQLEAFPHVSPGIDAIWHGMMLDSRGYLEFCEKCAHSYIHHRPKESRPMKESEKIAADWFFERYAHWFGESPSEYFRAPPTPQHQNYCSDCA